MLGMYMTAVLAGYPSDIKDRWVYRVRKVIYVGVNPTNTLFFCSSNKCFMANIYLSKQLIILEHLHRLD